MTDFSPEEVATLLLRHGLTEALFDPVEIAHDLSLRSQLNDSLDDLLDGLDRSDPTVLDQGWTG